MSERLIVQVMGLARSGKSEVSQHLAETYGFEVVSVSDIIRSYAADRAIQLKTRLDYFHTHTKMREELGHSIITDTILNRPAERICVDGIRVPADVYTLRALGAIGFALWCPVQVRYERDLECGGGPSGPHSSVEAFEADEAHERYNSDPNVQSIIKVMLTADYDIFTNKPVPQVYEEVDFIMQAILARPQYT